MSKKKKSSLGSIAIKINAREVSNLFFRFLFINIALIITMAILWCIKEEQSFYGSLVEGAQRSFQFVSTGEIDYRVVYSDGKILTASIMPLISELEIIFAVLIIIELIFILEQIFFGTSAIRKKLKPLNEAVDAMNRLSELDLSSERFQNIENAISKISPVASNERIHIGDDEFKGLEDAINNLLDRMRESYRQQARFVSDASHELRTPIAVIQGYANMLDRWGKKDEAILDESIVAIKSESESMKILVEQLLFLARGINGKTELKKEKFLLNNMISEVYEESMMIDENHYYRIKCDEDIYIEGDIALLKQSARILVENAAKYTENGGIITLSTGRDNTRGVYFYVQDSGVGMDETDVPHIFERFFRADTARVRKNGGTGLGLSIAKWIIDNHNGYFGVLSRKNIGTRIIVFLQETL